MSIDDIFAKDPPLEFIALEAGVPLERSGDRLLGLCPLHSDTNPSFAIWRHADREWVGCWGCGFGPTDAIGLVRALHGSDHAGAMVLLRRYAEKLPADWKSTALPMSRERSGLRDFRPEYIRAARGGAVAARELLARRAFTEVEVELVLQEFKVCGDEKYVVAPHLTPSGKVITALKWRTLTTGFKTLGDGTLAFLYGCWRDRGERFVVLTEGETDCWRLACFFADDPRVLVLALPHGACGPKPAWLTYLEGRTVLVLFDGDNTGQVAADAWREARPGTRSLDPGYGLDACDLTNGQLREKFLRFRR